MVLHSAGRNGGKVASTTIQADTTKAILHFNINERSNFSTAFISSNTGCFREQGQGPKVHWAPFSGVTRRFKIKVRLIGIWGVSFCLGCAILAGDEASLTHKIAQK